MKSADYERLKVLHVISGLDVGGSEMMLFKLVEASQATYLSKVIVLKSYGAISSKFHQLDSFEVEYLEMKQGSLPNLSQLLRLRKIAKSFQPKVVQGWMYHGNLAAWLVTRIACP